MTLVDVQRLTDEERLRKTAELCGWKELAVLPWDEPSEHYRTDTTLVLKGKRPGAKWQNLRGDPVAAPMERVPKYLNSLDAMHEAEKVLTFGQWSRYVDSLYELHEGSASAPWRGYEAVHATARQRNTAFLMTLP